MSNEMLDAVIVGAGFGGVYQLKHFRDAGYRVKLLESGSDYGGVWYWNRYPGARVDSAVPYYEFSDPELWVSWSWSQRFPDSAELRRYFAYVAEKWALQDDTVFDSFVEEAAWKDEEKRWVVTTKDGEEYKARLLLLNTGFATKRHIPDWQGVNEFKGRPPRCVNNSHDHQSEQERFYTHPTGHTRSSIWKANASPLSVPVPLAFNLLQSSAR